jgi:catechol 2,3-dioxygenase-like lactoylglutathione lyase family enzyme
MAIVGVIAQLRTTDLEGSIRFYTTRLGLTLEFRYEDFYAGIRAGDQRFHLKRVDSRDPSIEFVDRGGHFHLYLQTDDARATADALRRQGVPLVTDVHDTPWGTRELVIKDDQGHTIYFGEDRAASRPRPQPLIAVGDVEASSRWYQRLLGCRSGHGGKDYEQLLDADGRMIMQLHAWEAHEHPHMGDPARRPHGNGVLLWFEVAGFDGAMARVNDVNAEILEGPRLNPNANHREVWVRDPDGYVVVLAGAYGDV